MSPDVVTSTWGHPSADALLHQQAFENSLQASIIFTLCTGAIIEVNTAACNLIGYAKKHLLNKTGSEIFDLSEEQFRKLIRSGTTGGQPGTFLNVIKKNGRLVPCEISSAVFSGKDRIKRAITTITDRSHTLLAQQKVDAKNKKVVTDNIDLAISRQKEIDRSNKKEVAHNIDVAISKQKVIDTANEELVAHNIVVAKSKQKLIDATNEKRVAQNIDVALTRQKVKDVANEEIVAQNIDKAISKQKVIDAKNDKILSENIQLASSQQENIELMQAKLVKTEKIYKAIVSSVPGSVICLLDASYCYLLINGDMLKNIGYSAKKMLNRKAADVLTPGDYAMLSPHFQRVFNDEAFSIETPWGGHDFIMRLVPLKDRIGKIYAAIIIAIDVSELKKAESHIIEMNLGLEQKVSERTAQLESVNKELEAFTYSVSHDLRTPLRIINSYTDILVRDITSGMNDEGTRVLGAIRNNVKRMSKLIDDLLKLSRLGRKNVTVEKVDMNRLVKSILDEQLFSKIEPGQLDVADLLPAHCDPALLTQVWINLISNAVKYSGKVANIRITIGSYKTDMELVYSIKDNGVGFDMAYADKLFGVFQRLHKSVDFEGTGIGLALVQRIILKHGGKVWAEAAVNEGATFYFSLPVKPLFAPGTY